MVISVRVGQKGDRPCSNTRRLLNTVIDWSSAQYHPRGMNLLLDHVKNAISDLAQAKGIKGARVLDKVNRRGDLVIALIIPPSRPGEWTER